MSSLLNAKSSRFSRSKLLATIIIGSGLLLLLSCFILRYYYAAVLGSIERDTIITLLIVVALSMVTILMIRRTMKRIWTRIATRSNETLLLKARLAESEEQLRDLARRIESIEHALHEQQELDAPRPATNAAPRLLQQTVAEGDTHTYRLEGDIRHLLAAYNHTRVAGKYVPVSRIVSYLVVNGIVSSEDQAVRMISRLAQGYPEAIRIEAVRGHSDKQLRVNIEELRG
jgi:hypothetical protein